MYGLVVVMGTRHVIAQGQQFCLLGTEHVCARLFAMVAGSHTQTSKSCAAGLKWRQLLQQWQQCRQRSIVAAAAWALVVELLQLARPQSSAAGVLSSLHMASLLQPAHCFCWKGLLLVMHWLVT